MRPSEELGFKPGAALLGVLLSVAMNFPAPAQQPEKVEVLYEAPHANGIDSVVFSPDGRHVMSSGRDGALKLWDVASGHLIRSFQQHKSDAYVIAFSPDGSRVISESEDETLKLWDTATGRVIRSYQDQSGVGPISFTPDGTYFVTQDLITPGGNGQRRWSRKGLRDHEAADNPSDKTNTLRLWDSASGQRVHTLAVKTHVHALWFSADGKELTTASQDFGIAEPTEFQTWDVANGQLIRTVMAADGCNADEGAFSLDGRLYVARSIDSERWKTLKWPRNQGSLSFVVCEVTSGQPLRTFEGSYLPIQVSFSPDGKFIAAAGYDNDVTIWDVASGTLARTLTGHSDEVHSVLFSPDGTKILSGSHDMTIRLWDAKTGELIKSLGSPSRPVTSVTFSADGAKILTGSWDQKLRLWDSLTGRLIRTFEGHSDEINAVAFSPDGSRVASASDDTTVKLWDAASGRLIFSFDAHPNEVTAVAFSPDGLKVMSAGGSWQEDKGTAIELWDARTGQPIQTLSGHTLRVTSVAFSPDGSKVLSGSFDKSAKLWDLATGELLATFNHGSDEGSGHGVTSVAFSPDGTLVLSADEDGDIKLWDVTTGELLRTFVHGHSITAIAVTPDFSRLASASGDVLDLSSEGTAGIGDKTVKIWDVSTGQLLRTLKGHSGGVKAVAFSPDGARLLSGAQDTTANLWNAETGELLASIVGAGTHDWLAVTPYGFFNSSRNGGDLLAVVRNSNVISIDQMRQSLFDPDLVREAITGDLQGEVREAAKAVNLSRILDTGPAPAVAITSHPLLSESADELVTLETLVSDRGKGIGRIEWRVNGITAAVGSIPPGAGRERTVRQSVALDPGENSVEVVAYNEANLLASVPARVTIKFSGQADRAKAKLYVLAIGINAYPDPNLDSSATDEFDFPKLTLAVNDAAAFGRDIKRAGDSMYQDVAVTLALDGDGAKAKLEAIIDKLATQVQPRDTFIFFAAAHGVSMNGHFALIPQDFQGGPDNLASKAIGQDELQSWLSRIKAKKAIVLLDTCESGALVAGHFRSRTDVPASEATVGRLHEATGRPVLTAAAQGQSALGGYEGHGVFTWAVLEALRKGDTNGNGTIELSELVNYVETVVPKISGELNGNGRAAIGLSGSVEAESADPYRQRARFGAAGEDFTLIERLH